MSTIINGAETCQLMIVNPKRGHYIVVGPSGAVRTGDGPYVRHLAEHARFRTYIEAEAYVLRWG